MITDLEMKDWPRPTRLIRYFSERDSDFFDAKKLWFSKVKYFNDPFEVLPNYSELLDGIFSDDELKKRFAFLPPGISWQKYRQDASTNNEKLYQEYLSSLPEKFQADFSDEFGVICFCENLHSLLMWAHYASSHEGFVVEFDTGHPIFRPEYLGKVYYPSSKQRVSVTYQKHWKLLLTKSPEWEYETEFRLIMPKSSLQMAERRKNNGARMQWYIELPSEAVRAVYLGCRMKRPVQEEILRSLGFPEWGHVEKFRMKRHPTKYTLCAERIP